MKIPTKQSFLFRIDGMFALKDDLGTIITGHILSGKVRIEKQVIYADKNEKPIFECIIADIERLPMTKLTEAAFEKIGNRTIALQIFGHLKHEFEEGGFIMNME